VLSQGVTDLLYQSYPQDQPATVTLYRPARLRPAAALSRVG
jgi:hypothetical protein